MPAGAMTKAEKTRELILNEAVALATSVGIEGLTIRQLAEQVGMSKSGLHARFKSREDLQIQVVETVSQRFTETVLKPALQQKRGLERLKDFTKRWVDWLGTDPLEGGGLIFTMSHEFAHRKGGVHDVVNLKNQELHNILNRLIDGTIADGALPAGLDKNQFIFELTSIVLGYYQYLRIFSAKEVRQWTCRAFEALFSRKHQFTQ